jgi:chromosome segregation ATPase
MEKDKPQSGTEDEQWTVKKCCNGLQKETLSVTQESDGLRSEHEELKVNFYELQREYNALQENMNAVREERDTLQRKKDEVGGVESTLKMILEGGPSIQKAYLLLCQERDTLKSEHEELKANFDELKRKCSALTDNLNAISQKCDALQRDKDKLLDLEDTLKMMWNEESSIQEAYLLLAQERNNLKSEQDEFRVDFDELIRVCNTLKENLNIIRERGALQKDKNE